MKWRFGTGRRVISTGALAADGTLYLGGHGGALLALESRTGRKLWSFGSAGTPTIGPDGTIYCAGAAYYGTSPLAVSPWPKFHRDLESRGRAHARPLLAPANSPHTSEGFKVHVYAELGDVLNVESTTDLQVWTSLQTLTNTTGNLEFFDPSGLAPRRFYRVALER
jgi:outer membrane protein assembly factor BamB